MAAVDQKFGFLCFQQKIKGTASQIGVPIPIPNSGIPVLNSIPNSGIENWQIPVF